MSPIIRSKFKVFLIGFVLLKIAVVTVFLSGLFPSLDFLMPQRNAAAQSVAVGEEVVAESGTAVDEEKEKQYAEIQAVMNQLEAKRQQLKEEEEQIKKERAQLEQLKLDLDMKLEELKVVQAEIDASIVRKAQIEAQAQAQQDAAEAAKIKQLVKVYTSMSPKQAAGIIDKLDMKVVHQVFSNMKGEEVGQILTYVNVERAAEITERLAAMTD